MLLHKEFFKELTGSRLLRVSEQAFRWPLLHNPPLIHEDGPVSHIARKAHFMGHDHHRAFSCASWRMVFSTSPTSSGSSAEVGSSKDHVRAHRQRARNRHALLLPARQTARIAGLFTRQPDFSEQFARAPSLPLSAHLLR
jgi:hypothetical protein